MALSEASGISYQKRGCVGEFTCPSPGSACTLNVMDITLGITGTVQRPFRHPYHASTNEGHILPVLPRPITCAGNHRHAENNSSCRTLEESDSGQSVARIEIVVDTEHEQSNAPYVSRIPCPRPSADSDGSLPISKSGFRVLDDNAV